MSFLILGIVLIGMGAMLWLRPKIVIHVASRYNKRTAQWLANHGVKYFLDDFDNEQRRMRVFFPLVVATIGVGFCIFGIQSM